MHMFIFTICVVVIFFFIINTFIVVTEREVVIVERLGNFKKELKAGFHFLFPFLDRVVYFQESREQFYEVPAQNCITKDNMQVEVDGIIYLQIMNAYKASYNINDYKIASINLAQTNIRSEIGKLTLDEAFGERDKINISIVSAIDEASESWGLKVLRYEIQNIKPSPNIINTLEKQMEAERQKRANIIKANGIRDSKITKSEGDKMQTINISEGEKQKDINLAQARAKKMEILSESQAEGISIIKKALNTPNAQKVINAMILQTYISEITKVLQESKTSIVPFELANIKGILDIIQSNKNKKGE